jgi:hypothetical protein
MFAIKNADDFTRSPGRVFNVRIVREGDRYGLDDCLVYDTASDKQFRAGDALVEFYDATQDPAKFGPRGQFVARYYLSTLLGQDRWSANARGRKGNTGLALDGGIAAWTLDGPALDAAIGFVLDNETALRAADQACADALADLIGLIEDAEDAMTISTAHLSTANTAMGRRLAVLSAAR